MYSGTHKYDSGKNRIYTSVIGMMRMEHTDEFIEGGKRVIDQAKPGFTVVMDYSQGEASPADVNDKLGELRQYLANRSPKRVVTVVNKMLMKSLVSQKLKGDNLNTDTFASVEEADRFLDSI
ncbi:hypothetical protein [Paenibacillus thermotolerans]|uniref:hypothetical protein n=1 Tax=Paenibacillus thermotolerans TaxID=3027807 RepID=UPI0023674362|nr:MULTISPECIES: hypothetical protein [unclassified Paenibacillus]